MKQTEIKGILSLRTIKAAGVQHVADKVYYQVGDMTRAPLTDVMGLVMWCTRRQVDENFGRGWPGE